MTITAMTEHKAIHEYGGGKLYKGKNTLRGWLSEVAPEAKHVVAVVKFSLETGLRRANVTGSTVECRRCYRDTGTDWQASDACIQLPRQSDCAANTKA